MSFMACVGEAERGSKLLPPPGAATAPACGPTIGETEADASLVPDIFLIGETPKVTRVIESQQGYSAAILLQIALDPALEEYRSIVKQAGYEILNEDYEGFEAEIYMREGADYVTLQLRETACEDETVAYLRVIYEEAGG
jgi:hypothetical protein